MSGLPDIVTCMGLRGWGVRTVGIFAVAVLISGCSGKSNAVVTPSLTPAHTVQESPTPSPSPSPSMTVAELTEDEIRAAIPEVARTEDFWAAQEFTRYFLENYQDMMRSDPRLFSAFSNPDCTFCHRTLDYYADLEANGHSADGGHVTVTGQLAQGGLQDDGTWGVIFDIEADPLIERDAAGEIVTETAGGSGKATVLLDYIGYWSVLEIAAEAD